MYRHMIVARVSVALGATLLGLLLYAGPVYAHDLGFDSDLDENGIVQFSNPNDVRPGLFNAAIDDWNQKVLDGLAQGPIIVNVTDNPDAFIEVTVRETTSDAYLARTVFRAHPDRIDLGAAYSDLPFYKRLGTATHELGHTRGADHTGVEQCETSILATRPECNAAGTSRIEEVGPHDVSDTDVLWYAQDATHPVANKCWTNVDADGDGVCDRYGPPAGESGVGAFSAQESGRPVEAPDLIQ